MRIGNLRTAQGQVSSLVVEAGTCGQGTHLVEVGSSFPDEDGVTYFR